MNQRFVGFIKKQCLAVKEINMRTLIKLFVALMLCISPSAYAEKPSKSANKPIAPKVSCPTGTSNTQKTKAEDLALLKAKAEQGNAGNHWSLGYRHEGGFDVAQDYVKAVEWYMLAAAQGDAAAQVSLGSMYDNGRGVGQDYAEAAKWYKLAAVQGYAIAQNNLGFMYDNGRGVAQDYAEAAKWFKLAAAEGYSLAQLNLGLAYQLGKEVVQDDVKAHMWFNLAASKGRIDAVSLRDRLAIKMTAEQIAQAQKLATECSARNFKGCSDLP
jgi:uncharacterized protein